MSYKRLNEILQEKGISRYRLAKMSRISHPDLYRAISGERSFYPGWKRRVADALEMKVEEVFPGDEDD